MSENQDYPNMLIKTSEGLGQELDQVWKDAVLRGIHAAMLTVDLKGRITYLNGKALDLFQVPLQELKGKPALEVTGLALPELDARVSFLQALEQGQRLDVASGASICTPAGTIQGWLSMGPLRNGDGEVFGAVILLGMNAALPQGEQHSRLTPCTKGENSLFVRRDGEYVRIEIAKIQAVEAMENYVQILTDKDRFVVHSTMKLMQEKLQCHGFVRVHRSFLLPLAGIMSFDDTRVTVVDKHYPVGKSYRADLMRAICFL